MKACSPIALTVAEFEIEEHVSATNRFFQQSTFTLDDLDAYAGPFAAVTKAAYWASKGNVTDEQAIDAMRRAIRDLQEIDDAMDLANAA